MLEVAGVEGFLANADTLFDQADSDAVQWESFLLTLAELFDGEPFRVTDVVQKLEAHALLGGSAESKGLREALLDFLAEAGDRTGGFFQRRLASIPGNGNVGGIDFWREAGEEGGREGKVYVQPGRGLAIRTHMQTATQTKVDALRA
jgi:hypothetical protein